MGLTYPYDMVFFSMDILEREIEETKVKWKYGLRTEGGWECQKEFATKQALRAHQMKGTEGGSEEG